MNITNISTNYSWQNNEMLTEKFKTTTYENGSKTVEVQRYFVSVPSLDYDNKGNVQDNEKGKNVDMLS